eukprot:TRINITY_DN2614_c0_g1_i1.p1 TRINITY_DN2614_c0_g1~~TRINITY_DN2614_c0_g1_i1.p1  ORF type:complete len:339 (+),score=45.46 TRINITY_DN2614_c0_g1_i1:38-1018(+)
METQVNSYPISASIHYSPRCDSASSKNDIVQLTKHYVLNELCFSHLTQTLRHCFEDEHMRKEVETVCDTAGIQYVDDENDLVVLKTTDELVYAFKLLYPSLLHIVLKLPSSSPTVVHSNKRAIEDTISNYNDNNNKNNTTPLKKASKRKKFTFERFELIRGDPWPKQFERIFLDGNNMRYCVRSIRNLSLGRGCRGDKALASLTELFCIHVTNCVIDLVFDHTSISTSHHFANGSVLNVSSARPKHTTTDDSFVEWATLHPDSLSKCIAVTSDVELCGRLSLVGMATTKPSHWFNFVVGLLTEDNQVSYEKWIDSNIQSLMNNKDD